MLKQILEYIDVSDVNMEQGSLRVDANVSARPRGESALGTKTELKNLNSFSAVERALRVEFARHVGVLSAGLDVVQQTMLWDESAQQVRPSRAKEDSHDYRYFPEPDLPSLILATDWIDRIRHDMPELPAARRRRFAEEYALGEYDVDVLTADPAISEYFEAVARGHGNAKSAANWVTGELLAYLKHNPQPLDNLKARPADLSRLLDLVRDGIVGLTAAKKVFALMLMTGDQPEQIAHREGLLQVNDTSELQAWLDDIIAAMPTEWDRLRRGEQRLQGVLIGAVMKKSGGRADPKTVAQLLGARLAE